MRSQSKTVQQHLHVKHTRIRLTLLQPFHFFARITSNRNATVARPDADTEVESYLSDTSTELFPWKPIQTSANQVYLKLNTGLRPASAAVERLFFLGGWVFSPLRSHLSSEHFEMMLFLRTAAKWWNFRYSCGDGQWLSTQTLVVMDTWFLNDRLHVFLNFSCFFTKKVLLKVLVKVWHTFGGHLLVLVLPILFSWSICIGTDYTFEKYC